MDQGGIRLGLESTYFDKRGGVLTKYQAIKGKQAGAELCQAQLEGS